MIIKKDYLKRERNFLEEEQKGLEKAVENFDKRYHENKIERDNFIKGLQEFSKRGEDLKRRIEKK